MLRSRHWVCSTEADEALGNRIDGVADAEGCVEEDVGIWSLSIFGVLYLLFV